MEEQENMFGSEEVDEVKEVQGNEMVHFTNCQVRSEKYRTNPPELCKNTKRSCSVTEAFPVSALLRVTVGREEHVGCYVVPM